MILPRRLMEAQSGCNALEQHVIVPWLGDEVERSGTHAFDSKVYTAPGRHQNDRHFGTEYLYLTEQGDTFDSRCSAGKIHIHQDKPGP